MKPSILTTLVAGILGAAAIPAGAAEVWLCAKQTVKSMPDGSNVTMWGYAHSNINFADECSGAATAPGPELNVPIGDNTLTVHLRNDLAGAGAEPVSVVVPGLTGSMAPVRSGTRITSFTAEAGVGGGIASYTWNNVPAGTFLYHSGTHPAVQVQMGLYGALLKNEASGQAYAAGGAGAPDTHVAASKTVLMSEIDPVLHAAVASGSYGSSLTSTIDYKPKYFLVNGTPVVAPVIPSDIARINNTTMVRLINAGLKNHSMTVDGLRLTVVAEDGKLLPYPKDMVSVLVGAQQTVDVLIKPTVDRIYTLYDRIGMSSTNGVNQFGGLMASFEPVPLVFAINADSFTGNEDAVISGNVLDNDTSNQPPPVAMTATLETSPVNGALAFNADGSFNYTPAPNWSGQDSFTYSATDGVNASATATVNLNVLPVNDAPVALADGPYSTAEDTALTVTASLLANDTDIENNALTAVLVTPASHGTVVLNADGAFTYTPALNFNGTDSFAYQANDGQSANNLSNVVTVSIEVTPVNDPPTVNAGADKTITLPASAVLSGTITDVDSTPAALWTQVSGPGTVTFGNAASVSTTASFSAAGIYVLQLDANDNNGEFVVQDQVQITVNPASIIKPFHFSTFGNTNPPGVNGIADDADIYYWNVSAFSRFVDVTTITNPVPTSANADEIKVIDATHFYMSFVENVNLPGLGPVQDEDIVYYNAGTWSVFFDGTPGLGQSGNQDIDAFSIVGDNIYFSTFGNTNPQGVTGTADDADIYLWNGTAYSRVVDMTTLGVPTGANVDGLEFLDSTHFYVSFTDNVTIGGVTYQDEDIVYYNNGVWSEWFDGTAAGLTQGGQDIDGFDIQP
jgi:VCBS repeat-containing protein